MEEFEVIFVGRSGTRNGVGRRREREGGSADFEIIADKCSRSFRRGVSGLAVEGAGARAYAQRSASASASAHVERRVSGLSATIVRGAHRLLLSVCSGVGTGRVASSV